ncbi:MAG: hypothetical protein ACOYPS_08925 [Phycisphaerales bacterium]
MKIRWLHQMWLRTLALLLAVGLTVFTLVSLAAAPVWPIVGVAVATVAILFNGISSRLDSPTCLHCGTDIKQEPGSQYGIICPRCGGLNEPMGERPDADRTA